MAHFVTYDGVSEPLHGHNYRASVTVEGSLQDDHFVFNFVTLKRIMRGLVDQLDHLTLLPEFNPHFRLTRANGEVLVEVEEVQRHESLPHQLLTLLFIAGKACLRPVKIMDSGDSFVRELDAPIAPR